MEEENRNISDNRSLEKRMHLAQQGDQAAYSSLLKEITQILRGYLMNRISEQADVEDIMQEVLISVHKARHTYDKSRPFRPWLFAITKFRINDYFRKVYRKVENEESYKQEIQHFFNEHVTESDDTYEELNEALSLLSKKQRTIIELMKVQGYTAKEVANQMNMSESAVKVSAHRSYKFLREKMEKAS